jgi:hypothetical protein
MWSLPHASVSYSIAFFVLFNGRAGDLRIVPPYAHDLDTALAMCTLRRSFDGFEAEIRANRSLCSRRP